MDNDHTIYCDNSDGKLVSQRQINEELHCSETIMSYKCATHLSK